MDSLRILLAGMSILASGMLGSLLTGRFPPQVTSMLARVSLWLAVLFSLPLTGMPVVFGLLLGGFLGVLFIRLQRIDAPWLLLPFSLPIVFLPAGLLPAFTLSLVLYALMSAMLRGRTWTREILHHLAFLALSLLLLGARIA